MKGNYLLSFFIYFVFTAVIFAAAPDEIFESANNYYNQKDFYKAIENYELLVNQGYGSEELFFNLGNAYFRINKIGEAILNFEKALKLSPGDEDIKFNLAFVNSKTIDKIEPVETPVFVEWWYGFINLFSVNGWTLTAYAFYFLALAGATAYFFSGNSKFQRNGFFAALIFGSFFIFTAFMTFMKINYDNSHQFGIVIESSVAAKLSPDNTSGDAFVIHEGTKVNLEDNFDNWIKIKLADGKIGWINQNEIKII